MNNSRHRNKITHLHIDGHWFFLDDQIISENGLFCEYENSRNIFDFIWRRIYKL